jgi:hypothetical protein
MPMIDGNSLQHGKCYFFLSYFDHDLRVPDIKTLIFIGPDESKSVNDEEEKTLWVFQDPTITYGPDRSGRNMDSDAAFHRFDEDSLFSIYDWEGLIQELLANKKAQDIGKPFNAA